MNENRDGTDLNPIALPAVMSRRNAFKGMAGLAAGAAIGSFPLRGSAADKADEIAFYEVKNGNINQSVVHWCFNPMSVEELARNASLMGIKSVELVGPQHWDTLKKYNLTCALAGSHGFVRGLANRDQHDECIESIRTSIDNCADAGFPSVITFSGMGNGISDEEGIENMVDGVKKIIGHAEKKKINLCLEMLNSRVDVEMKGHPGYLCDTIEWAVEVCERVGSERMKILFDIYHVQIMQGDVITRIKQFSRHIGHYHTAGNPGRNEINNTQEINYPPIMRAILETGYQGYVGQEFIPTIDDKMASLNEGVRICDV